MKAFDLEKALAGEKVITRDGDLCTQFALFKFETLDILYCVVGDELCTFDIRGQYNEGISSTYDLFMAAKKLSGFINIYDNSSNTFHAGIDSANQYTINQPSLSRIACIDLSQFDEGEGL